MIVSCVNSMSLIRLWVIYCWNVWVKFMWVFCLLCVVGGCECGVWVLGWWYGRVCFVVFL